jgi:hypothetical protein
MLQSALNRSRSDKFLLVLDIPVALKEQYSSTLESNFKVNSIQFSVIGAPTPTIAVPEIDIAYGGQVYKTSSFSRKAYNPLAVKFLIDNGYKNYFTIWKWLNLLNDYKKSTSDAVTTDQFSNPPSLVKLSNPMSHYTSNFTIYGLDEFNNKIISFVYTHAFPTSLSEINFSSQDPNEISSTVSFVFNQLEVNLLSDVNKVNC